MAESLRPPRQGWWLIGGSFLLAFLISAIPLPDWISPFRPDWVALVLIYWCVALPDRVGPVVGMVVGLMMDVLQFTLLGHHSIGKAILGYLANRFHLQIRNMPLWQQSLGVMVLIAVDVALVTWIHGTLGTRPPSLGHWWPVVIGALFWPWVFLVLRDLRRRARVK